MSGAIEFTATLYTRDSNAIVRTSPLNASNYSRVSYVKETSGNTSFILAPYGGNNIETASQITVQPYECITLINNTNRFNLLNVYKGYGVFSGTTFAPGGTPSVYPTENSSTVLLDLTSGSKVIELPKISSTSAASNKSLFLSIKDRNGLALTSPFYVSSTGGDFIDRYPSVCISDSYACLELAADPRLNVWHILNYFPGYTPIVTSVSPGTTVSTVVLNVTDDITGNKFVDLPNSTDNVGKIITIRNSSDSLMPGFTTYVNCFGADVIDTGQTGFALSNLYQTIRIMAVSPGNWIYLQNFTTGLS